MANETNLYTPIPFDKVKYGHIRKVIIALTDYCSDSRNSAQAYYPAKETVLGELFENGTWVDFFRMNDPGVFMTEMSIDEKKEHILKKIGQYSEFKKNGVEIEVVVNTVGHANARRRAEYAHTETISAEQLTIINCVTNCGMAHAQEVGRSLVDFVPDMKPTFKVKGKNMLIRNTDDFREYARLAYKSHGAPPNWNGDIMTWVKSIRDYGAHPRDQMRIFDESVKSDLRFVGINIHTFAFVLSYTKNKVYRVDEKPGQQDIILAPIFNEIRRRVREEGPMPDQKIRNIGQHAPILVISDPLIPGTRNLVVQQYGINSPAGVTFSIARKLGSGPFDIYSLLGGYYALSPRHLNTTYDGRLLVAGVGEAGIERAYRKIHEDQIFRLITDTFAKEQKRMVVPASVVDPRQSFSHRNPNGGQKGNTGQKQIR
jgi:hypothetical protein